MTLAELDAAMREDGILAVNIQFDGEGFRVHVRRSQSEGFTCAQKQHPTVAAALGEHFASGNDLSDLLV